jgi:nicotinate-nucleotide adenylyltransferase
MDDQQNSPGFRQVGIFGGTFDPVHFGHLRAASEARERLCMAEMRLLPAGRPPHRRVTFAAAEHRLAMLKLALAGQDDLHVDDREVRRSGYSYMVDTLREIRGEEGDAPLLLMIGQDAANKLDSWYQWRQLFALTHLVIMRRPDSTHDYAGELLGAIGPRMVKDPKLLQESPAGLVLPLEVTQLAISSTDIRRQIAAGNSPRFLLPDSVIAYIREHQLYAGVAA